MRTTTVNIFSIAALTLIFSFGTVSAGEWVKVIEMGESGVTIEFPMTPAEIAMVKASRASLSAIPEVARAAALKKLKIIEMGEGGHTVVYPMTAEEIIAANAENARLAAIQAARPQTPKQPVVGFEMAESGQFIAFPVPTSVNKLDLGDAVIARDTSDPATNRVQ